MKYLVTQDDLNTMEHDLHNDRTLKHLKDLSFYKFTIGDVLIRQERYRNSTGEHEWKTKLADCGIANKYVYVFENELGIGYIRRLSVNGRKFVDRATCVTEFDPDLTRFSLDPEYADHMLLSEENAEFDAKSRYDEIKKKREQINRQNKKLRLDIQTEDQAIEWLKNVNIGDTVWFGYSIGNINKYPYSVDSKNINVSNPARSSIILRNSAYPQSYGQTFNVNSVLRYNIFTSRPIFMDEIIN